MKNTIRYCSLLALACLLLACGRVEQPVVDTDGEHTCTLRLVGGVVPFDGGTKGSGVFTPSSNNRIYVRLTGALGPVMGTAKYDEGSASWKFTYNGSLGGATSGAAHAVLFERMIESEDEFRLTLNYKTPIYEDASASFSVGEDGFTLNATLAPKTGRISFVHDLSAGYGRGFDRIGGISYYWHFNLSDFSFDSLDLSTSEGFYFDVEDGNEDDEYVYGFFTDEEDPQIMLCYWSGDNTYYFYRHMPPSVFRPGQSGYVYYPDVNLTGWRRLAAHIELNIGRWYDFRFVPGGTFRMGNDGDETARPVHDVTLGNYYMGQFEVTEGMWASVMGDSSYGTGSDTPVTGKSYEEIQSFIMALNAYSTESAQYRFRLPTEAEWEYAARGAIYSRGYMYSGSNEVNDVSIHYWPYSIGVRNGNELSLYEMSGGVAELCSDWYAPYSDEAQVNPTGPASGDYRVARGGSWRDPDEFLTVWHRVSAKEYESNSDAIGFRLVMEVPVLDK